MSHVLYFFFVLQVVHLHLCVLTRLVVFSPLDTRTLSVCCGTSAVTSWYRPSDLTPGKSGQPGSPQMHTTSSVEPMTGILYSQTYMVSQGEMFAKGCSAF